MEEGRTGREKKGEKERNFILVFQPKGVWAPLPDEPHTLLGVRSPPNRPYWSRGGQGMDRGPILALPFASGQALRTRVCSLEPEHLMYTMESKHPTVGIWRGESCVALSTGPGMCRWSVYSAARLSLALGRPWSLFLKHLQRRETPLRGGAQAVSTFSESHSC